jgi:signal transduction histidine kinase
LRVRHASLAFGIGRDLLLAIAACGAALLVLLSLELDWAKQDLRARSLDQAAQYVASRLLTGPAGTARLPVPLDSSWASFGYPVVVLAGDGRVLLKRPPELDLATVRAITEEEQRAASKTHPLGAIKFFAVPLGEQQIIAAALLVGSGDGQRVIIVFKDENAPDVLVDDVVRQFPSRAIEVLAPIFAMLLLAGAYIVWRRTRPIANAAKIAGTIGPYTLNLRLPEQDLPREVLPIVRGVNGALQRLEQAAAAQREFLGRAAHHLRTPLTVLSARADSLDGSETAQSLRADVREMARTISQLLQLNDIEGLPEQPDAVADLGAVAESVRHQLAKTAARRNTPIELTAPDVPVLVRGDPNVIEVAVRNLVENALQHSPPGAVVGIAVAPNGRIAVADAGPGIADALRDKIFEPFWSGDPEGARAGLGLTVVRRVAERYGAAVTVRAAPGSGTVVAVDFVPAPAALGASAAERTIPASLAYRRRHAALDRATG